ncbi:MAG: 16S rRNA (cytosine(1402)-N(4))-methyltransferase, partial [Ktedonobacterales bacterium]|nr:16S rRNA (cytosine(1402)-N(4))-methyltransferase [Ktedonobacterales bacterium]
MLTSRGRLSSWVCATASSCGAALAGKPIKTKWPRRICRGSICRSKHLQGVIIVVEPLTQSIHIPVLPDAVVGWLRPHDGGRYLDATLGGGGHTAALLAASAPSGRVLAIDADPAARARVAARLSEAVAMGRLVIAAGNFRELGEFAAQAGLADLDGVLMDLGLSSDELADRARGFSFTADAPLDMRFDPTTGETAADIL